MASLFKHVSAILLEQPEVLNDDDDVTPHYFGGRHPSNGGRHPTGGPLSNRGRHPPNGGRPTNDDGARPYVDDEPEHEPQSEQDLEIVVPTRHHRNSISEFFTQ